MNSKQALDHIKHMADWEYYDIKDDILPIKQDLDRLEKLEKENQELKEKCKILEENEEAVLTTLEISVQENDKLKKVIETSLKEYELMKQTKIITADKEISNADLENIKNQRMFVSSLKQFEIKSLFDEETQNKLKALEIIKNKHVNVNTLIDCMLMVIDPLKFYNEKVSERLKLTQQEFGLLKEWLENE